MALYRYSTRERLTYPTKVPYLSDKQVKKTNAEVKRVQEEQVQWIYARRKSTDWKVCRGTWTSKGSQTFLKAFVQENSAFYTQLSLHICIRHLDQTFELGGAFRLHIYRVTITYDIIACKNKTANLKSAKWNWTLIRQIKFPPNFPAIRYIVKCECSLLSSFWSLVICGSLICCIFWLGYCIFAIAENCG